MHKDERYYAFGPYTVDPVKALLWRDGTIVPIARKTISVLIVLLEEHGEVVTKDEIFTRVWSDTFVEENTLSRHIATLRKALGSGPAGEPYIQTVTGRGYQFVADVRACSSPVTSHHDRAPHSETTPALPVPAASAIALATDDPPLPVPQSSRRSRPWLVAALLASAAAAAFWLRSPTPRPSATPARLLTHERGIQEDPTWAPGGGAVAFASDRDGTMNVWIQPVGGGPARRVTSPVSRNWQPSWSPDGKTIAFRSERDGGGIYLVDVSTGAERRLLSSGFAPRWSADGRRLLLATTSETQRRLNVFEVTRYFVADIASGTTTPIPMDELGGGRVSHAAWAPDGQVALWGRHPGNGWTFVTVDVTRGTSVRWSLPDAITRQLDDESISLANFEWPRTGSYLYFQGESQGARALWRVGIAPKAARWVQGPELLTNGAEAAGHLALSGDGAHIAYSSRTEQTRLWSFPFDPAAGRLTGGGTPVTSGGADEGDPTSSVDGSRLVYRTVRGGRRDLWQLSLVDGRERLLLDDQQWRRSNPHASADGTRLVYVRSGQASTGATVEPAVVVLSPDNGDERVVAAASSRRFGPTDWSPDGRAIIGGCRDDAGARSAVCLLPLSSAPHAERDLRVLAADPSRDLYAARFAPNQRWISFNAVGQGQMTSSRIYAAPIAGGPWTTISGEGAWDDKSRWAPDGRAVYYVSTRGGVSNVWGRRFDPVGGTAIGAPFQVTNFSTPRQVPAAQGMEIVVTRNRLVVPITETSSDIWILDTPAR